MNELTIAKLPLPPRLSYLILVHPALVAVDISQAISDFVPRANVIIVQCAEEAGNVLNSGASIDIAFLGLSPRSETGRRLAEAVRAQGGRLVFIGDEAEDHGPGPYGVVLERPFDTHAVSAAIMDLRHARLRKPADRHGVHFDQTS